MSNDPLLPLSYTLLPINLKWRWLLPQAIVLKLPKDVYIENWVYYLQDSAVGGIQLVSCWSYLL